MSIVTKSASSAKAVESNLAQITRAHISNPPAFGARIAAAILGDSQLRVQWDRDLVTMSSRIAGMRKALYKELEKLGKFSSAATTSFGTHDSCNLVPRHSRRLEAHFGAKGHVLYLGIELGQGAGTARYVSPWFAS